MKYIVVTATAARVSWTVPLVIRAENEPIIKELIVCFQNLVSGKLHTFYSGRFPSLGIKPGPWSQTPNYQQYMTNALPN